MSRKTSTLLWLERDQFEEVKALARRLGCSVSSLLREGLELVLKAKSCVTVSVQVPDTKAKYWAVSPEHHTVVELTTTEVANYMLRGIDLEIMPYDQSSGWTTASKLGFGTQQRSQEPEYTHGNVAGIDGAEESDTE